MTDLRENAFRYIRTNWGAPFVLAFIVLLIASAALLGAGQSGTANNIAVYAFYALVLGVVLQIASYIKYGESQPQEKASYVPSSAAPRSWKPRWSWRPGKRTLAVIIVVIVIVAGIGSTFYLKPSFTPHKTIGQLSAGVNFIVSTPGANNSIQLMVGINETGGVAPYNFTGYWSDGLNQTNNVGVFIRSILQNQSIPASMKVVVSSADRQNATVLVMIPIINRTFTTISTTSNTRTTSVTQKTSTTNSTTASPAITFTESGLPSDTLWSVSLGGVAKIASTNQIVFNVPAGTYNYTLSEPYLQNFSRAFVTSPLSGTVSLAKVSVQETVTYSTVIVTTPTDKLFQLVSDQSTSFSNGTQKFNITYSNSFPVQVNGIAVAIIKSNSTGLIVAEAEAPIQPQGNGQQSVILQASGLAPGVYNVNLFVQTSYGLNISELTNSTVTIS